MHFNSTWYKSGTRTTSVCQRSARRHLEGSYCQSTCQRTKFLLGEVSRQLNPEKDPPDDQTKALTFSSGILRHRVKRGTSRQYRTSNNLQNFRTIFPELGQQALAKGNLAALAFQEPTSSVERQDIATSSQGSSGATPSTPRRSTRSTRGIPPRRYSPSRVQVCAETLAFADWHLVFIDVKKSRAEMFVMSLNVTLHLDICVTLCAGQLYIWESVYVWTYVCQNIVEKSARLSVLRLDISERVVHLDVWNTKYSMEEPFCAVNQPGVRIKLFYF